ncbi:MAG: UDP-N-acetylenolpyruvoylglucosamine reductase [Candidatus Levybacteria bacterium RBG_16_35_11]|nr:MAG: UDP-N-acetylenolpyruvoylglucosamine reductase [Candidatus Levybacteria bacterium RBG_16_35_11]
MIKKDISLKDYSNYKIGGLASYFLEVLSINDLVTGLKEWKEMKISNLNPPFVLAAGTKVLIDDKDYNGLIIHNKISGIERDGNTIKSGSGVKTSDLLNFCMQNSLSGLEWGAGLPGTIGGAVRGNAGAFKGETKDIVLNVSSLNFSTLKTSVWSNKECKFDYRDSIFKSGEGKNEIITEVLLKFTVGNQNEIKNKVEKLVNIRETKHPMGYPSLGSTFKNIPCDTLPEKLNEELKDCIKTDPFPLISVVKLLSLSGLKGARIGGAQISEKQPNFIINLGNASSNDVKALIKLAKERVMHKFGIKIEEEIVYLG